MQTCQGVNGPICTVLRDCLVFFLTSKRIELQTWDWSSFIDILEKNMHNSNIESTAAKRPVDTCSKASKDCKIDHKIATTRTHSHDISGPPKSLSIFKQTFPRKSTCHWHPREAPVARRSLLCHRSISSISQSFHFLNLSYSKMFWLVTRSDTRPIPVLDGWAGAEMRFFNPITTDWQTNGPKDGPTDRASYKVVSPRLKIRKATFWLMSSQTHSTTSG